MTVLKLLKNWSNFQLPLIAKLKSETLVITLKTHFSVLFNMFHCGGECIE